MTRSQIRNLILQNTNRADKSSIADSAIDLAFSRLGQMNEWQQTRLNETVAIAQGDSSFTLVTGCRRLIEIRLINGIRSYPLTLESKVRALEWCSNPTAFPQNFPRLCYWENDGSGNDHVLFFPVSNGNYSIEYTASFPPTIGASDSAIANIPDSDECIVAFGTWYVFKSIEQLSSAAPWEQQFAQLAAQLIAADNRRPAENVNAELHDGFAMSRLRRGFSADPQNDPFAMMMPYNTGGYGDP